MIYDKKTVVGALEQCQMMLPESSSDWETLEELITMAKEGKFSKPTLQEVWKEKCNEADQKGIAKFCFEFNSMFYHGIRTRQVDPFHGPILMEKL